MTRRRSKPTTELPDCQRSSTRSLVRLGAYQVVAPLARGGTSGVYLGVHAVTGQHVALKVLDPIYAGKPEIVERLFGERTVSERVQHASLLDVQLADHSIAGIPYVVMELLEGENLGALAERGRIELDAVIAIAGQIAGALAALHAAGVAHCDVKPENVIVMYQTTSVGGFPRVKVIDYGVATMLDAAGHDDQTIAGTPSAMAPEQWRGAPSARSDVYGLGCLLYELVTGEHPFHGTLPQLMQAHCEQLPARPAHLRSDVPPALDSLVMGALQKDPAMRPTMLDLEAELARIGTTCFTADAMQYAAAG